MQKLILLQGLRSKMATESIQISSHTVDKVNKAKVTLENFYSNLISQHEEREHRLISNYEKQFRALTYHTLRDVKRRLVT